MVKERHVSSISIDLLTKEFYMKIQKRTYDIL
jgi:hypothetical protein